MKIAKSTLRLNSFKQIPLFQGLDEDILRQLVRSGQSFKLSSNKGDQPGLQISESIYLLTEGKAFLSCIGQDGKKIIAENLEEGDVFGKLDYFGEKINFDEKINGANYLFVEPLPKREIVIFEFNKASFVKIVSREPMLALKILWTLSKRVTKLEKKVQELTLYSLEERVLMELTELGNVDGQGNENIKVEPKVTHEKLAQSTGTARETVSKTVAKLKRVGVIFYDKNKAVVVNLSKLKHFLAS